jgi:urocanate hydratase
MRTDPGIGVIRHADAGYASSLKVIAEDDLAAPMLQAAGAVGPTGDPA